MNELSKIRPTILEVSLDNLAFNIRQIRKIINQDTKIMAVVKANGYGHGSINVSKIFLENGADMIGVSLISEAIELRKADIDSPILVLNYTPPTQIEQILQYDLTQTIYSYRDANILSEMAVSCNKEIKIHIKIDTGMGRIGFIADKDSIKEIIKIVSLPNIILEGIFTHFPCADEQDKTSTRLQYQLYCNFIDMLNENRIIIPIKHVSNSACILDIPEYNLDMVRAGCILYGHYPSEYVNKNIIDIKPAVFLKSIISNIKWVQKGFGISYGHTFITGRDSKIGTVPLGYADGYSRMLSGKAEVCVKGKRAPIVGLICMDQLMIDITEIDNVQIDDEVILLGYGDDAYQTVEEISRSLQTNDDDVICMLGRRIPRVYIADDKIKNIIDYILD